MVDQTQEAFDILPDPRFTGVPKPRGVQDSPRLSDSLVSRQTDQSEFPKLNKEKTQLFDPILNPKPEVEADLLEEDGEIDSSATSLFPRARPESFNTDKISPITAIINYEYLLAKGEKRGITRIVTGLDENNPEQKAAFKGVFESALGEGADYDPRKMAWCATFVHHILTKLGADVLNSKDKFDRTRANEYRDYGTKVESYADIKEGDLVLLDFHKPGEKGHGIVDHIGFYAGTRVEEPAMNGYINVVGGNQGGGEQLSDARDRLIGGAVTIRSNIYKTSEIVAIRRITYNDITFELNEELLKENPVFAEFLPTKYHVPQTKEKPLGYFDASVGYEDGETKPADYNQGGLELGRNNPSIDNQMETLNTEPVAEPLLPVADTTDNTEVNEDGFLDTAFENARTPLAEARELFLTAGSGAVFDTLKTKDDPRVIHALARVNDYIAGTGYAGYKTGEAAVGFVLGAIADFIGQDQGEPLAGILGTESQANRMLYSMPEALAGSAGTRSITVLDDALDNLPEAVSMLKNGLPLVAADLKGSLRALSVGDLSFLKESKNPPVSLSAAVVGDNNELPINTPTLPKGQVAPLVKDRGENINEDFYSPLLANINNLAISSEGMLGSNIIKFLQKRASNLNTTELNWSQLLYPGKRIAASNLSDEANENLYPYLGIDPTRKYTKAEIQKIAKENVPQIRIQTINGGAQRRGKIKVKYEDVQRVPVLIGKDVSSNVTKKVIYDRGDYQTWAQALIDNNPSFSQSVIDDLLDNFDSFSDYDFNRFANGIRNTTPVQVGMNSDYVEIFIKNDNPLGNKYRSAKAHFPEHPDGENIVSHTRGAFYTLPNGKKIFVAEEFQSDAIQAGGGRIATPETTLEVEDYLREKKLFIPRTGPKLGSVENEQVIYKNLSDLIQKNVDDYSILPSARFNRLADIEMDDPFALQKQEEALSKLSFDANKARRIFDTSIEGGNDFVDSTNNVLQYLLAKYERFGISLNSLQRRTVSSATQSEAEENVNKIITNFLGDVIYTKGVMRRTGLNSSLSDAVSNVVKGPIEPILNLSPAKLGETVRLSILSSMKVAKENGTQTIVVPPLEDLLKNHGSDKIKAFTATYIDSVLKTLKTLKSETNNKVSFQVGKLDGLEFESQKGYMIINFDDLDLPENSQIRFAEGGVVRPMEQELEMQNMLQQGGIRDDGMNVDPVSGNEIPSGSLAKEVRDDIPAQLSEGEYVVPADVVRFFGVKYFEDLRMEAKQGLQAMEENGRIGGEPVPVENQIPTNQNQMPTNQDQISDVDIAEIEKMLSTQGMAAGGLAQGGMIDRLVNIAKTDPMVNERMSASGMPIKMAVGGSVGQQVQTSSLYSDPKKIDDIIAKVSSAASQNPQLMRMLGERGISVPTTVATKTPQQIQEENKPQETLMPIVGAVSGADMGNYSVNDITNPTSISNNYLTPGLMTQRNAITPTVTTPAVTTPEVQAESTVGGYNPNPLPLCPIGQVRDHNGICVGIQDYDGSKEDDNDPFSSGDGQAIGKPWYEDADFNNYEDLDDFISGKLQPSKRQTGLGNIVSNIPLIKLFSEGAKYNNISQSYAAAKLALAAKKVTPKEYEILVGDIEKYISDEKLNPETVDSFFQGDIRAAAATRKFAGEDGEWTNEEWNNFTNQGRRDEEGNNTVNPRSNIPLTGKVTTGSENFNKTAVEKAQQAAGEARQLQARRDKNQNTDFGFDSAKTGTTQVTTSDGTTAPRNTYNTEAVIKQAKENAKKGIYRGGRAKGGLMTKKKKKK